METLTCAVPTSPEGMVNSPTFFAGLRCEEVEIPSRTEPHPSRVWMDRSRKPGDRVVLSPAWKTGALINQFTASGKQSRSLEGRVAQIEKEANASVAMA